MFSYSERLCVSWKNAHAFQVGYREVEFSTPSTYTSGNGSSARTNAEPKINSSYYICHICQEIARDPIVFLCCRHWMCGLCFLTFAEKSDSTSQVNNDPPGQQKIRCPNCSKFISRINETSPNPALSRLIEYWNIRVHCSFDCGLTDTIKEIEKHERYLCEERPVECPSPNCTTVYKWNKMKTHLLRCPYRTIYCPNCRISTRCSNFAEHNCIQELLLLVGKLQLKVLDSGTLLEEEMLTGVGGAPVYKSKEIGEKESTLSKYCSLFCKTKTDAEKMEKLAKAEKRKNTFLSKGIAKPNKLRLLLPSFRHSGRSSNTATTISTTTNTNETSSSQQILQRQNAIGESDTWSTTSNLSNLSIVGDEQNLEEEEEDEMEGFPRFY